MRMGFGLAGLLITIGVIVMWYHFVGGPHDKAAVTAKKNAEEVLQPMTGSGVVQAKESIDLGTLSRNGKFDSLIVRAVASGGVMAKKYGLQKDDVIIKLNGLAYQDINITDEDFATERLFEVYSKNQSITVMREGVKLDLPQAGGPKNPAANTIKIPSH